MAFNATTGLGTATKIATNSSSVTLSLGGSNTFQLTANVTDNAGTANPGTAFTLTAVATSSGGVAVYTGTITGGGSNAFAGQEFVVAGFVATAANNGTFLCTASSGTTLTLQNAAAVAETHAATATSEGTADVIFLSYNPGVATVSVNGLITGVSKGQANIEVSFPTFNNTVGNVVSSGNIMNGTPLNKIHKTVKVQVNP